MQGDSGESHSQVILSSSLPASTRQSTPALFAGLRYHLNDGSSIKAEADAKSTGSANITIEPDLASVESAPGLPQPTQTASLSCDATTSRLNCENNHFSISLKSESQINVPQLRAEENELTPLQRRSTEDDIPAKHATFATDKNNFGIAKTAEPEIKTPVFTGKHWMSFRNKFESLACYENRDPQTKAIQFYHAIQGDAADALSEADSQHWSYERLVQHIGKRHGQDKTWADIILARPILHVRPKLL